MAELGGEMRDTELERRVASLERKLATLDTGSRLGVGFVLGIAVALCAAPLITVGPVTVAERAAEQPAVTMLLGTLLLAVAFATWFGTRAAFRIEEEGQELRSLADELSRRLASPSSDA